MLAADRIQVATNHIQVVDHTLVAIVHSQVVVVAEQPCWHRKGVDRGQPALEGREQVDSHQLVVLGYNVG